MNEEWNEVLKAPVEGEPDMPQDEDKIEQTEAEPETSQMKEEAAGPEPEPEPESQRHYDSYQFSSPVPPEKPQKPPKHDRAAGGFGRKLGICVALAVIFGLVAGLVFQAVNIIGGQFGKEEKKQVQIETTEPVAEPEAETEEAGVVSLGATVTGVAKSAMPSVVAITNISVQEIPNYFGFGSQQYEGQSSGSGIIVGQNDTELLIATNNHVVSNATTLTVLFAGQETAEIEEEGSPDTENAVQAQIKGTDADNDLAVIAVKLSDIPAEIAGEIKVCQIGDSDSLEVGEQVVAIGNALGYGQSVTAGYVSALNRKVSAEEGISGGLIQTDAAINPGNSGGALLNMKGELIGINAAKYASSQVEGMGYAIPVAIAEPILNELMNRETRYKVDDSEAAYIGVVCKNVTAGVAEMYDMPVGVLVSELTEGGPAQQAGILKRDIITKMDGQTMETKEELVEQLTYYSAGETIEFEVQRANEKGDFQAHTISVTLGNKKDMPQE